MIGSLSSFTPLLTSLKSSTWLTLGSGIVTQKYACRLRATHTRPSTTPHLGTKGKTQHHNSSFTQFSFSRFPAAVGSGITTHQSSALQPILLRWRARVVFQAFSSSPSSFRLSRIYAMQALKLQGRINTRLIAGHYLVGR